MVVSAIASTPHADANATIESLRADVSAGRKRLQVAATCAKSTTGASSMGDGESP
ncbi:hypothetical protein FQ039_24840, partial [Escherichia coli]|nr:hypothetical protein [Escherichia coli]